MSLSGLLLVLCLWGITITGEEIRTWEMALLCGQDLAMYDHGGRLNFDAKAMLQRSKSCEVTVSPTPVLSNTALRGYHQALFYFSAFDIGPCDTEFVSIREAVSGKAIQGLPERLCGENNTLLQDHVYFVSTEGSFRVSFRNLQNTMDGRLTLYFNAFSEGQECDEESHLCPNSLCVAECSPEFRVCGDTWCANSTAEDDAGWNVSLVTVFGFVFVVFVLVFVFKDKRREIKTQVCEGCGRFRRGVSSGLASCSQSFRNCFRHTSVRCNQLFARTSNDDQQTNSENVNEERSPSNRQTVDNPIYIYINDQPVPSQNQSTGPAPSYAEAMAASSSAVNVNGQGNGIHIAVNLNRSQSPAVQPTAPSIDYPTSPPPAYEEAIASGDATPNYEEFMANQEFYEIKTTKK